MTDTRALRDRFEPCERLMLGSGTDTYDPLCELAPGHVGPCRSMAAIDQHGLKFGDLIRERQADGKVKVVTALNRGVAISAASLGPRVRETRIAWKNLGRYRIVEGGLR